MPRYTEARCSRIALRLLSARSSWPAPSTTPLGPPGAARKKPNAPLAPPQSRGGSGPAAAPAATSAPCVRTSARPAVAAGSASPGAPLRGSTTSVRTHGGGMSAESKPPKLASRQSTAAPLSSSTWRSSPVLARVFSGGRTAGRRDKHGSTYSAELCASSATRAPAAKDGSDCSPAAMRLTDAASSRHVERDDPHESATPFGFERAAWSTRDATQASAVSAEAAIDLARVDGEASIDEEVDASIDEEVDDLHLGCVEKVCVNRSCEDSLECRSS